MLEFREWARAARLPDRPWLVIGKGPSFSRRGDFPLERFNRLGLNDVAGDVPVHVAHVIDIDVIAALGDRLVANAEYLLMPRRPHVDNLATERTLESYFDEHPVLREFDSRGRLAWYNARTGAPVGNSPVIRVRHFSSEAAIDLLGELGVRTVRSLGIDGGVDYAAEFARRVPFGNGRVSFDAQFREIEDIVRRRGIDYDPLVEPMRVFVGTDASQAVATRVLEYTIRKHASRPVRFMPMVDLPSPRPKDPANRARTGFSFSRFHIPALAGRRGRALYLDSDMQVFADIAELWDMPLGEHTILCTRQDAPPPAWESNDWFHPGRQMSVMVLDCERLDWDIERIVDGLDAGDYGYDELLFNLCIVPEKQIGDHLSPAWNHLEHYEEQLTKLVHYTVVPTQPWKADTNPLGELWEASFHEAVRAGLVYPSELALSAQAGHLKRSLAGLPPSGAARRRVDRLRAGALAALRRADERFPPLRHPAVARLRSRLGRL